MATENDSLTPFALTFIESGPEPVVVDGRYDESRQLWVPERRQPEMRTNYETSQPTVQSTNLSTNAGRDFTPDQNDDTTRDFASD